LFQAIRKFAKLFSRDENQLSLDLIPPARPKNSEELEQELNRLGLKGKYKVRLTRNRTVVVSYGRGELRIHQSFLDAPEEVWRAIVMFVHGRTRAARGEAKRTILEFPVDRSETERRPRKPHETHPDDLPLAVRLTEMHARYNAEHFEGKLRSVPIRISRRMRSRLGHYSTATEDGFPAEIVISRRHYRRHGWEETLHTLLHEMVHQWQDESGQEIDHGREFRRKARAVGVAPHATRRVA
jgi:hypothetical protein